jgi:hypothetical protein
MFGSRDDGNLPGLRAVTTAEAGEQFADLTTGQKNGRRRPDRREGLRHAVG